MGLKTTRKPKVLLFIYLSIKPSPYPKKITLGVMMERENKAAKPQFLKLNPTALDAFVAPRVLFAEQQRPTQTM